MPVDVRKPLGLAGLNLGSDEAIARDMIVADGVRFESVGTITGRLGRVQMGLSWPDEGVGNPADYVQTIHALQVNGRTRGFAPYYDQRINSVAPEELNNPRLDTTPVAYWAAANGFTFPAGTGQARYDHNAAGGTLTQTVANMAITSIGGTPTGDAWYILEYDIVTKGTVANTVFQITTSFAAQTTTIPDSVGSHRVRFKSRAAPGSFVLSMTSTAGAGLLIETISLKLETQQITLPQRLNIVYKKNAALWFNDRIVNDPGGQLFGDGAFIDPASRAKIVTRGREIYAIDSGSRPKIVRPLSTDKQLLYKKVKYDVRPMGIDWPRSVDDIVSAILVGGVNELPVGLWRFRIVLENDMGDISSPSLEDAAATLAAGTQFITVNFPRIQDDLLTGTNRVTFVRMYASYQAAHMDGVSFVLDTATPSEYKFIYKLPVTTTSAAFGRVQYQQMSTAPTIPPPRGIPPKLRDMTVVNDVAYSIPDPDVLYREAVVSEGEGRPVGVLANWPFFGVTVPIEGTLYSDTTIKAWTVTPDMLLISPPGQCQYVQDWIRFGRGEGEFGIGVSVIGNNPVIFTNQDIIVFDPESRQLKRVHSSVGALSRDSIQKTEDGVRFLGTDGVPRLFNGATVDEIADELMPIFSKEDYAGYYKRFNKQYAQEVTTTSGNRRFYMNYPVAESPGDVPGKLTIDPLPQRNMAIADSRWRQTLGRPLWVIDTSLSHEQIQWLGRESKLVGVDFFGRFYFLEEGFFDAPADSYPPMKATWRWFASPGRNRFRKLRVEINTFGNICNFIATVDGNQADQQTFIVYSTKRQEFKFGLPGRFRGQYLEIQFVGSTGPLGRPVIYDVQVEQYPLGVF